MITKADLNALEAQVKELEEQTARLEQANLRYQNLIETTGNPMGLYDREGVLLMINRAASSLMKGRPGDLMGKRITDLFPSKGAEYLRRIREALASGLEAAYEDPVYCIFTVGWVKPQPHVPERVICLSRYSNARKVKTARKIPKKMAAARVMFSAMWIKGCRGMEP